MSLSLTSITEEDAAGELAPVCHVVLDGRQGAGASETEHDGGQAERERLQGGRRAHRRLLHLRDDHRQLDDAAQTGHHRRHQSHVDDLPVSVAAASVTLCLFYKHLINILSGGL